MPIITIMTPQQNNQIEDFTEKQLKLSFWLVKNRPLFKKIGLGLFIAVDAIFLLYGLYGFVDYLLITGPREAREIASMTEDLNYSYSSLNIKLGAKPLDIKSTILLRGKETYDALSFIKNRNENWLARFKYQFAVDSQMTELRNGFILPGEGKFITDLGLSLGRGVKHASVLIDDLRWSRISTRDIPDYEDWSSSRLNFEVSETDFSPAVGLDQGSVSRASFIVKNLTAFSYWQVGFRVILYRGATIVGVNYITIPQFKSGEIRDAEVTWFEPIGQVSRVDVAPEVDIFDAEVYMR